LSLKLGQYFSFVASTWHEIVTWFGYKFVGVLPEYSSSFSWEDNYSNLLGTHIAVTALQDSQNQYDTAMTLALDRELAELGVRSWEMAKWAGEKMRGKWFSGRVVYAVKMKKRNFDIGADDGHVSPVLVPGMSECWGIEARAYPVPRLDDVRQYGFSVKLEIKPKIWESKKIRNIAYRGEQKRGKRIEPDVHFPRIMERIRQDAVRRGLDFGPTNSDSQQSPE